ncbi:MAG: LysR family transcriptional regulator substrate-binding protein [Acutalibacteraceae bacterium]
MRLLTLPARPGCRCTPLYEDALAAVLPKGHPLGQSPVCRVEELAKEPFISLLESSNHDVRRAFHAVKARPNIRFETKDDYAVIAIGPAGTGREHHAVPAAARQHRRRGDPPHRPARQPHHCSCRCDRCPAATRFADFAVHWVRENT